MHENALYIIVKCFYSLVAKHELHSYSGSSFITCNNSNKKIFYGDFLQHAKGRDFYIFFRVINQCDKREKKHRIQTTELHRFDYDDDEFVLHKLKSRFSMRHVCVCAVQSILHAIRLIAFFITAYNHFHFVVE